MCGSFWDQNQPSRTSECWIMAFYCHVTFILRLTLTLTFKPLPFRIKMFLLPKCTYVPSFRFFSTVAADLHFFPWLEGQWEGWCVLRDSSIFGTKVCGKDEGKARSTPCLPFYLRGKICSFSKFGVANSCYSVKTTWEYIFLFGKSHIIVVGNVCLFYNNSTGHQCTEEPAKR